MISKWIDNTKEPLQELEDVQFCMPDPHSGWVDWQEMILAYSQTGDQDEYEMMYGLYFPDRQEFVGVSGVTTIKYDKGIWTLWMPSDDYQVLIHAYFPISPLPNFDIQEPL